MSELSQVELLTANFRFEHEGEEFQYTFYLGRGTISFERKLCKQSGKQASKTQRDNLYPGGDPRLVSVAIIILYKAYDGTRSQSNILHMILPNLVKTISRETWPNELKLSVQGFGGKTPVADVKSIMRFIEFYSDWNPKSASGGSSSPLSSPPGSRRNLRSPLMETSLPSTVVSKGSGSPKRRREESTCEAEKAGTPTKRPTSSSRSTKKGTSSTPEVNVSIPTPDPKSPKGNSHKLTMIEIKVGSQKPATPMTTPSITVPKRPAPRDTTSSPITRKSSHLGTQANPIPVDVASSGTLQPGNDHGKNAKQDKCVIEIDLDENALGAKEKEDPQFGPLDLEKILAQTTVEWVAEKARIEQYYSTLQTENETRYKSLSKAVEESFRESSRMIESCKNELLEGYSAFDPLVKALVPIRKTIVQERERADKAESELEEMKKRIAELEKAADEAQDREKHARRKFEQLAESLQAMTSLL